MSAHSLKLVDDLIALIKPNATAAGSSSSSSSCGVPASSASSASVSCSVNPDVAWFPVVPVGHTEFSWLGEDYVNGVNATAPAPVSAAPANEGEKKIAKSVEAKSGAPAAEKKDGKAEKSDKIAKDDKGGKDKKDKEAKEAIKDKAAKGGEKKDAKQDKAGAAAAAAAEAAAYEASRASVPLIARLDVRVGRVLKAWNHPKADRLYVEEIDVGEATPRQVISGLRNKVPLEEFIGSKLLVICNLQPAKMVGETSFGMVLAASNDDHSVVELVKPDENAKEGSRVTVSGVEINNYEADKIIDGRAEGSVWRRIAEKLVTDDNGVATWDGKPLLADGKQCRVKSLNNKHIG